MVAVAETLEAAAIPFAFGGALALGYASEPRATTDIDINVFLSTSHVESVFRALREDLGVGFDEQSALAEVRSDYQVRIDWSGTYLDIFFAFSDYHTECGNRARTHRFEGPDIRSFPLKTS